jgi:glycosyltransferase involved in cell wall biosynthesis
MLKNKVCYIVSDTNQSHQLQGLFDGIKQNGYDVSLIFIGSSKPNIARLLQAKNFPVNFIPCAGKFDFPHALKKIYSLLGEIKPDIVHTHFQTASLLGLTAAKLRGIKGRIYTRHHSTELHDYHPHAVFYDKYCNALALKIIAISQNVKKVLVEREKVNLNRITVIYHGFKLEEFKTDAATVIQLKKEYNLTDNYPVIGVISRLVKGKGIQFIIPAFADVLKKYPKAKLVLAGAKGDYAPTILGLLEKYLMPENYVLIDFESRIFELYRTFDMFIHVPINREYEAFGQTYIEALALEVPSVFTLSGVAPEFIVNERNALVVDFCNSHMITQTIETIVEDSQLRERILRQGKVDVENLFNIGKMIDSLDKVYSTL